MFKRKGLWIVVGLLLLLLGFSAMILQLVGVNWAFLAWLERGGLLWALVLKVVMVLSGVVIVVLAKTDWDREFEESAQP